ncbi:MAG: FISUMP domain-containing protein [Balneolaceae bacterium]
MPMIRYLTRVFIFLIVLSGSILCAFQVKAQNVETVTIGSQTWMTENLNVDRFRNGDPIPQAKTIEEWEEATKNEEPVWGYYDNDPANGAKYGKLYNWFAVKDSRGLAPEGWHIPSKTEWDILSDYLGGSSISSDELKKTTWWHEGANGGRADFFVAGSSDFKGLGVDGLWWSSTLRTDLFSYSTAFSYSMRNTSFFNNSTIFGTGISVRVISNYSRDEYANRAGVSRTDSGLMYRVIKEGEGIKPSVNDVVNVHYTGFLTDGTVLDSSYQMVSGSYQNKLITLSLDNLIPGWMEGLQLMSVGAKYEFYIPAELAFGDSPLPSSPIAPGSDLLFYVELIGIE